MEAIDAADRSLGTDQQSVQGLMQDLKAAMEAQASPGEGRPGSQALLKQVMQSEQMQAAREMAGRMQPGQPMPGQPSPSPGSPRQQGGKSDVGNQRGTNSGGGEPLPGQPGRALPAGDVLLRLPPRIREELLQGAADEAPAAYQPFVQEYYRRLAQMKDPK